MADAKRGWKPNKESEQQRLKQQLAKLAELRESVMLGYYILEESQEQPAKSTPVQKDKAA